MMPEGLIDGGYGSGIPLDFAHKEFWSVRDLEDIGQSSCHVRTSMWCGQKVHCMNARCEFLENWVLSRKDICLLLFNHNLTVRGNGPNLLHYDTAHTMTN